MIVWDMDKDLESELFEMADDNLLLWDAYGKPYFATERKVIFPEQLCAVTAFDFQGQVEKLSKTQSQLSSHFGHKVDGKNHNWLIF